MAAAMNEPKPFASLNQTLLARKGGAKPAMRPQMTPMGSLGHTPSAPEVDEDAHEDLGWNDMGHDVEHPADADEHVEAPSAEIVQFQPEPPPITAQLGHAPVSAQPEIVRQQRTLAHRVTAPVSSESVERQSALADGRRAAFTLRVDAERHLKLRLACTVKGRSAQQLVTEALDKLLNDLPDLAELAERVGQSKR